MKGYGQFCPVAKACEVVGERWTPLVLRELLCGSRRFNDIHRGVPLMSPSLLSQRLKALERAGVVERRAGAAGRGPEYLLTPAGRELQPIIEQLGVWGRRWVQSHIDDGDLDASLLMWDVRRRIDVERFPTERTVIAFEFTDAPPGKRSYWLVGDREGGVEICVTDPGFEVDLYVYTDVRTMAPVWLGEFGFACAVESGAVELHGPRHLREGLQSWLGLGLFAGVERRKIAPDSCAVPQRVHGGPAGAGPRGESGRRRGTARPPAPGGRRPRPPPPPPRRRRARTAAAAGPPASP